jgi:hypothetical protein
MVRSSRKCDGAIQQIPGAREKGDECPYQDLTQVPLAEEAKACRFNCVKGTRQNGPVTSGEGVPAW